MEIMPILFLVVLAVFGIVVLVRNQRKSSEFIEEAKKQSHPIYYPPAVEPKPAAKAKPKSVTTFGTFTVAGYHHLPEDVQNIVWKELKAEDELVFTPVDNPYDDEAISVRFNGIHIGYIPKDYRRKKEIYKALKSRKEVKAVCVSNKREREYLRASRPDENGVWNDRYRTGQFVEVKFVKDRE